MSTPPVFDPATGAFGTGSPASSTLRRLTAQVRLPHARRHRSPARRVVLAVLAALAVMAVLLVLDGLWAGRAMVRGVADARADLAEGTVAVVTGDPEAAVPHFESAADAADSALGASGHPSISLASRLPWIGENLGAIEAIAEASRPHRRRRARDGRGRPHPGMARPAHPRGRGDRRRRPRHRSSRQRRSIDEVATELADAAAALEAVGPGRLVGPVATGYDDAVETLRRRAAIAADASDVMALLPRFLGSGAERQYLLAVQTLGRPLGVGGEVDLIGVLTADDGVMTLSTPMTPAGEAFAGATATTDARSAGENLLAAAREEGLGELDGVLLADSLWLADAVWTSGTAEVPERDLPVNPDEAPTVLEREVFEGRDVAAAATRRAEVATAIVESYLARRPATEAFATALARDVAERHLTIVATRGRERRILERLGADGSPEPPGQPPLAVIWNTAVDNQAAIFTDREVSHRVMLDDDGSAKVRTIVTLTNHADSAPPSALLGFPLPATVEEPAGVDPVGGWAADVDVLLPPRADRVTAETSILSETSIVTDAGRTTVTGLLATDPGDSRVPAGRLPAPRCPQRRPRRPAAGDPPARVAGGPRAHQDRRAAGHGHRRGIGGPRGRRGQRHLRRHPHAPVHRLDPRRLTVRSRTTDGRARPEPWVGSRRRARTRRGRHAATGSTDRGRSTRCRTRPHR